MNNLEDTINKCEYCEKEFSNKSSLNNHKKTAKYCLEKQGLVSSFKCNSCEKLFGTNLRLTEHISICKKRQEHYSSSIREQLEEYKTKLIQKDSEVRELVNIIKEMKEEYKTKLIEKDTEIRDLKNILEEMKEIIYGKKSLSIKDKLNNLFIKNSEKEDINNISNFDLIQNLKEEILVKDKRIRYLEGICLSKQKRVEYPEKNVVYLITTEDHIKRGIYIIGKAKNLSNRLTTYNKTCDHQVIYYKECKTEEDMNTAETLVLSKLKEHKEQANRDRFILPEDKDISYFISVINECINFVSQ